jgi:hypothetical protein
VYSICIKEQLQGMRMQYARILNELARPRLATYLAPLGHVQTKDSTRSHFLLNDISQHYYVPLQLIEIVLRNKVHQHASQALKRDDWYNFLPATKSSQDMVVEAKRLAAVEVKGRQVYASGQPILRMTGVDGQHVISGFALP